MVVSACYRRRLHRRRCRTTRTLVITAARHDRTSFGCADENDFTYFGRAFFKEALPRAHSFQDAFRKAEALVGEWEAKHTGGAAEAVDARVDDLRAKAAVPLDLGVDVADALDLLEELLRLCRRVATTEQEVEVAGRARLCDVDAVVR